MLVEVYDSKLNETIGNGDIDNDHGGITYASATGYCKLSGLLKPDTSLEVPFDFVARGCDGGLGGAVMCGEGLGS